MTLLDELKSAEASQHEGGHCMSTARRPLPPLSPWTPFTISSGELLRPAKGKGSVPRPSPNYFKPVTMAELLAEDNPPVDNTSQREA